MSKPLRVAVLVKNTRAAYETFYRPMGYWSYPVPEFTWTFFSPGKPFKLDVRDFRNRGFDLIFHEDGGNWGDYLNRGSIPVVYLAIDSTLTAENHFQPRYQQGKKADLVLVEHDDLNRWEGLTRPALRFPYCVNDKVFLFSAAKKVDVSFHNGGGVDKRARLRHTLSELCSERGWSYTSGALPLLDYAQALRDSRVVVNWPRNPANRPHRILDAMMSGAAVLTGDVPTVWDCYPGYHYLTFADAPELTAQLDRLLKDGGAGAAVIARRGAEWAANNTWAKRAAQLRALLSSEIGL